MNTCHAARPVVVVVVVMVVVVVVVVMVVVSVVLTCEQSMGEDTECPEASL